MKHFGIDCRWKQADNLTENHFRCHRRNCFDTCISNLISSCRFLLCSPPISAGGRLMEAKRVSILMILNCKGKYRLCTEITPECRFYSQFLMLKCKYCKVGDYLIYQEFIHSHPSVITGLWSLCLMPATNDSNKQKKNQLKPNLWSLYMLLPLYC